MKRYVHFHVTTDTSIATENEIFPTGTIASVTFTGEAAEAFCRLQRNREAMKLFADAMRQVAAAPSDDEVVGDGLIEVPGS